jgi:hypothetical protein
MPGSSRRPAVDVLIAVQRARAGQIRTNMPVDRRMQRLKLGLPCLIEVLEVGANFRP